MVPSLLWIVESMKGNGSAGQRETDRTDRIRVYWWDCPFCRTERKDCLAMYIYTYVSRGEKDRGSRKEQKPVYIRFLSQLCVRGFKPSLDSFPWDSFS